MILRHSLLTDQRTASIFAKLPRTKRVIDVGPGIRPCPIFPDAEYVCIEPHYEYCDHLMEWRPPSGRVRVIQQDASYLTYCDTSETTVLALDVVEHMEKDIGLTIVSLMEKFDHAVVFTPLGWYHQGGDNPDAWGLNGGYWQKHRSAWSTYDFKGWKVYFWRRWSFRKGSGAILAIR